jgi:hypothetical protein
MRIKKWNVCNNISERFGHYSIRQVPPLPALKIITATLCSAVQLLVELTAIEGRTLLGPHQFCRDIPRIVSAEEETTHRCCN